VRGEEVRCAARNKLVADDGMRRHFGAVSGVGELMTVPDPSHAEPEESGVPVSGQNPDELHAAWCAELAVVQEDVLRLHVRAEVLEAIDDEIVRTENRYAPGLLEMVWRPTYAEVQAIAVRRLVDERRGARSLYRLVASMAAHSTVLSRERYRALLADIADEAEADQSFDRLAGPGATHLSRRSLLDLRDRVKAAGEAVKRFVDEQVAHTASAPSTPMTWGQLRAAVQDLIDLYREVTLILRAVDTDPVPGVDRRWRSVFAGGLFTREVRDRP
jgi:hypothetical protein